MNLSIKDKRLMGNFISLNQSCRRGAIGLSLIVGIALPTAAQAQAAPRGTVADFERANRVAEALRQITLLGNTRNPGYYSDWQVKGDRIPLWSRQCLGRQITPEEFESNKSAATSTVTCIVQDMMRQEIRTAQNNEGLAIRRVASWWVTGDPGRYEEDKIAAYTQRVLSSYQPNGTITATIPAPPKPIYVAPINAGTIAVIPTPVPTAIQPGQLSIPTETTLPPVKPRQAVIAQAQPGAEAPKATPTPTPTPTPAATPSTTPTAIKANGTNFYDRYMQEGYVASRAKDYAKALLFFRRALDERPDDNYASTAIKNMQALTSGR
jgi:TolA-binding protein